ncbi:helix-turn-helix domain-containing protein [Acidithiobacillus sp. M4-SHS-6]|uniref:helix-turn-helix domain-containing protein n=1 Tax=Acidithiobacillus sp. M4-SHS-6 TaxID=3383024 RepID=UPI0039BDC8EA
MKMSNAFKKNGGASSPECRLLGGRNCYGLCHRRRCPDEEKNISRSELASRIETSLPYITKVMRGDANFTLETMAKIAMAVCLRTRNA